ncbi:MAG: thioredoxin family protein [Chloroflexi bacterium]|nr:thioredoxin family protein [Chloroflexota bacterium]
MATTVLNPGTQRVSFLLVGPRAIVKAPQATVSAAYVGDAQGGPAGSAQETRAVYHGWPYGIRGAYSAELDFDKPGAWRLDVGVDEGDVIGTAVIELDVVEDSPIPAIGERPPLSKTKTLSDVSGIEKLTTDYTPDEEMYRISVAEAIESPRPSVVVFSSPAFCTSPTCGPQLETVKELRATYQDRADFVHVEIYDLPDEIQGDLSRATLVEAVDEWGFSSLPHWFNESWVFIINGGGLVEQRFEGYATFTELEAALKLVLAEG